MKKEAEKEVEIADRDMKKHHTGYIFALNDLLKELGNEAAACIDCGHIDILSIIEK